MLRLVSFNLDFIWASRNKEAKEVSRLLCNFISILSHWPSDRFPPFSRNDCEYQQHILRRCIASAITSHTHCTLLCISRALSWHSMIFCGKWVLSECFSSTSSSIQTSDLQVHKPTNIPFNFRISYLIRFFVSLLCMEFILHFMYVVAIKDAKAWGDDSPMDLAMIGFWNLIVMWLKVHVHTYFLRTSQRWRSTTFLLTITIASHSVEILPYVGLIRWDGSSREHGSMCCEQLFDSRVLAKLASELQSLAHTVRISALLSRNRLI